MVSLATAIGEETERLKVEEMEKLGERTLNSAGGGKSKCRDKSWRRKSCNGLWWEILGLKVSKRNSWGPKTDKKKRRKNAGQRLRRAWFFNRARGWEEGCYRLKRREKVERRADQQCESGPILYRAIPPVRGWSHPIRAVWGIMQLRERDQPRLLSRRGKKAK